MGVRKISDDARQALADAVAAGESVRGVAKRHGVSAATVSRACTAANVDPEKRIMTEKAVRMSAADAREARQNLAADLLHDAMTYRALAARAATDPLGDALHRDARNLLWLCAVALDKHRVADDGGFGREQSESLLAQLVEGLREEHNERTEGVPK